MTEALADIVMSRGSTVDIDRQARLEGIRSMRDSGLMKVAEGVTTLEEVERVTAG